MPKCNICGAELTPGAKFCTGCGTLVPQDVSSAPEQPSFQQTPVSNDPVVSPAPEQPAPAATAFNQAVGSSASGQTAFEQAVSSNDAPKNIYSDVPQYGQPDAGTSQPAGSQPAGAQPGFNGQPPVGGQPGFNGQPPVGGQPGFNGQPPVGGQPGFNGQPPVGGQPGAGSFYYGQPASPQKKKTGRIAAIIAAVVAVIAIIVIVVVVLSNRNTYKTPIEKFEKGINNRDTSTLLEAFPLDPKYESLYKLAGDSIGDQLLSSFDSEYDGCKVKIEINDTERLTSSELSDAADSSFASSFGDDYDLTEGYYVYCTVKTTGNGSSESEDSTITVCKWDGKWYIFDLN